MSRLKRKITEVGTSDTPSTDPRFPTEKLRIRFSSISYFPLPSRYLCKTFFTRSCKPALEVIDNYGLGNLVYCTSLVNTAMCAELYNNLVKVDELTYSSRVGGKDFLLSPAIIREHLGLRHSSSTFSCYPPRELPFGDPYSHITLDTMYSYFFGEERASTVTQFSSIKLRIHDYVLYRVLVTCILPLTTRALATMRPFHSFLLYAFCHRLDIDISLHIFHTIIYSASNNTSRKIHMPYCHILTSLLASHGFNIAVGKVTHLSEFDMLSVRNFSLAGVHIDNDGIMSWRRGNQPQSEQTPTEDEEIDDHVDLRQSPSLLAPITLEQRVIRLEEVATSIHASVISLQESVTRLEEQNQVRHIQMMELFRSWSMDHTPPPPQ